MDQKLLLATAQRGEDGPTNTQLWLLEFGEIEPSEEDDNTSPSPSVTPPPIKKTQTSSSAIEQLFSTSEEENSEDPQIDEEPEESEVVATPLVTLQPTHGNVLLDEPENDYRMRNLIIGIAGISLVGVGGLVKMMRVKR